MTADHILKEKLPFEKRPPKKVNVTEDLDVGCVCSALPRKEPWQTKHKRHTYRTGTGDFFLLIQPGQGLFP